MMHVNNITQVVDDSHSFPCDLPPFHWQKVESYITCYECHASWLYTHHGHVYSPGPMLLHFNCVLFEALLVGCSVPVETSP